MNYNIDELTNLPLNIKGRIQNIDCSPVTKRRLLDLGLVKNTFITPILNSPSNGIKAYWFRNSLISIRTEDASNIFVDF